jgi:hypothetical protein
MRGAFVVRLRNAAPAMESGMEGWVEEVDTGTELHFRSGDELIAFLRERFAESLQRGTRHEGTK